MKYINIYLISLLIILSMGFVSADLTSWYKFNETSGNVIDYTGLNDGTNTGATRGVEGISESAFRFDAPGSDRVTAPDITLNRLGSGAYTVSAWVRPNSSLGSTAIISKRMTNGQIDYSIETQSGYPIVRITAGDSSGANCGSEFNARGDTTLNANQWYNIVSLFDNSNQSISLYVDGRLVNTSDVGSSYSCYNWPLAGGPEPLYIGNTHFLSLDFNGTIDEVKLYNTTLSSDEIVDLFLEFNNVRTELIQPSNNTNRAAGVEFKSNGTSINDFNISSGKLTIFDSDSNIIYTDTVTHGEDNTFEFSNFTVNSGNFTIGETYIWNVEFNATNGSVYEARSAFNNFTFIYSHIQVDSESYNPTVVEGSQQEFIINITYNSSVWNSITAKLNYDGTNYTGTQTGFGDSISFTTTIYIPEIVGTSENNNFNWIFSLTNNTNNIEVSADQNTQTVNELMFGYCNATQQPYINFTTHSATNPFPRTNATFKSSWNISSENSTISSSISYEDITETNSTWSFCFEPSVNNFSINATIEIDSSNYAQNFHYLNNLDVSNQTTNISLYLLNDTLATLTELKVEDANKRGVEDVFISIQLYDVGTDTFYNVGMSKTSSLGSDINYLNWYDSLYKFVGVKDGETVFSTTPYKIFSTPQTFQLETESLFPFQKFNDFEYSLAFNETSGNFVLTFVKPSGDVDEGCLRVIKRNITNDYTVCDVCESSSSATLYCNINSAGNGTFISTFYATGSFKPIDTLTQIQGYVNQIFDELGRIDSFGIAIILSGIILTLFLISPALSVVGILIGVITSTAVGFQPLDYGVMAGFLIVGGIVVWLLKR